MPGKESSAGIKCNQMRSAIIFLNNVHTSPAIVQNVVTYRNTSTVVGDTALASCRLLYL